MKELIESLSKIIDGLESKSFSCTELMRGCLENISKYNARVNAIVNIDFEKSLLKAKKADALLFKGIRRGILHGIPIGVKDNYITIDYPTTACSNVLKPYEKSANDAALINALKEQGAIVIAKTNMHEWAYGATNEISNIGGTRNPWNLDHITGGSSGGSAAGVASGMFVCALGSDTGGSIRIPCSGCGISGIKPTYDLLNKEGVLPLSYSLDVVGPMARSASDLEILLKVMLDKVKAKKINYHENLVSLKGLHFGIPVGYNFEREELVEKCFREAVKTFKKLGVSTEEVEIPYMKEGYDAWKTILRVEATTYHQKNMENAPYAYSENVRILLAKGEKILAIDYLNALQFRSKFVENLNRINSRFDALLFTTLPISPPKIGTDKVQLLNKTISVQESMTYLAWLANYAGFPQVSIPCGFGYNNLPIGLALMSFAMDDFKLLQISKCYQKKTSFHKALPNKALPNIL